jgi:uncharacterized damage-inducible protein DinB
MNTAATALKAQLDLHNRLFNNVLDGITEEESSTRSNEHINHIKWIAGHMLATRMGSMSRMAGLEPNTSYGTLFARGVKPDPNAPYPSLEEIMSKWNSRGAAISEGIAALPEQALSSKSGADVPISDDTLQGLIAFLVSHEAYHIGQLSLLRKMAGKEAMSFR